MPLWESSLNPKFHNILQHVYISIFPFFVPCKIQILRNESSIYLVMPYISDGMPLHYSDLPLHIALLYQSVNVPIFSVTAVEEYVFQAFDVAAFHYLVKPFSDEKFEEVVKRAVRSIEKYSENQSDEKYMMVQSGGSHMKVFLKDIVYAEVYNRKVIIHTRDTNIEYYGKLQELSEIAGADFFRTHRAYLIHFKYVQKYDANCVTMENGTALIAKQNYSEFVKQYLKYNQRKGKEIG